MTPNISEFSYGFALTNEIVGWEQLTAAPLFPSLIEEGRAGGGYDVKLERPGVPLYLQFKRADCMKRRSTLEIRDHNLPLNLPFYRFKITESGRSNQHAMLLALDDGVNAVFYAAPRFHELTEINQAWAANQVASRSIFVRPDAIGPLDGDSHHVAYDAAQAFLCSEPKAVASLTAQDVAADLQNKLGATSQPLRERLPYLIRTTQEAVVIARAAAREFSSAAFVSPATETAARAIAEQPGSEPSIRPIPTRLSRPLTSDESQLRELADLTSRDLGLHLVFVQRRDD